MKRLGIILLCAASFAFGLVVGAHRVTGGDQPSSCTDVARALAPRKLDSVLEKSAAFVFCPAGATVDRRTNAIVSESDALRTCAQVGCDRLTIVHLDRESVNVCSSFFQGWTEPRKKSGGHCYTLDWTRRGDAYEFSNERTTSMN